MAGLVAVRQRGRIGGRKPKVDFKIKSKIKAMKAGGIPIRSIGQDLGLARSTIYNYLAKK